MTPILYDLGQSGRYAFTVVIIVAGAAPSDLRHSGEGLPPPEGDVFLRVASRTFFPNLRSVFRNELLYRNVYEEIGFDPEVQVFLDYDFKLQATARYPVAYSGSVGVDYRFHAAGIHEQRKHLLRRDEARIYRKHLHLLAVAEHQLRRPGDRARAQLDDHVAARQGLDGIHVVLLMHPTRDHGGEA